jgi:hypothetical protein
LFAEEAAVRFEAEKLVCFVEDGFALAVGDIGVGGLVAGRPFYVKSISDGRVCVAVLL